MKKKVFASTFILLFLIINSLFFYIYYIKYEEEHLDYLNINYPEVININSFEDKYYSEIYMEGLFMADPRGFENEGIPTKIVFDCSKCSGKKYSKKILIYPSSYINIDKYYYDGYIKKHQDFIKNNKNMRVYYFSIEIPYIPKRSIDNKDINLYEMDYINIIGDIIKNNKVNIFAIRYKYMIGNKIYISNPSTLYFNNKQVERLSNDYSKRL